MEKLRQFIREEILKEIKVSKPVNNRDALDKMLKEPPGLGGIFYLDSFSSWDSFEQWDEHSELGYDEDDDKNEYEEAVSLAKLFFKWKDNGDIVVLSISDSDNIETQKFTKNYKNITTYGAGYHEVKIVLTTF
jgi:hypothetical protein